MKISLQFTHLMLETLVLMSQTVNVVFQLLTLLTIGAGVDRCMATHLTRCLLLLPS